jgi:hypothetical protein
MKKGIYTLPAFPPCEKGVLGLMRYYADEAAKEKERKEAIQNNIDKASDNPLEASDKIAPSKAPTTEAGLQATIAAEVRYFGIDTITAYYHQRDIKRDSYNFTIKLVSGHVFCECCMHKWITIADDRLNPAARPMNRRRLDEAQICVDPEPSSQRRCR